VLAGSCQAHSWAQRRQLRLVGVATQQQSQHAGAKGTGTTGQACFAVEEAAAASVQADATCAVTEAAAGPGQRSSSAVAAEEHICRGKHAQTQQPQQLALPCSSSLSRAAADEVSAAAAAAASLTAGLAVAHSYCAQLSSTAPTADNHVGSGVLRLFCVSLASIGSTAITMLRCAGAAAAGVRC
jgi:hypothetical protein